MLHPKMAPRGPVLWPYLRWSSDPQEWGDSERRQDEAAINCARKLDIPLMDGYRDEGTSAWTGANATKGDLRRFIQDIGRGPAYPMPGDMLCIENFDRLSRMERLDSIPLIREIIDAGVSIVPAMMAIPINRQSIKEMPWLFDYTSRELERAHTESTRKSESVSKAKATARERGRTEGTPISWGNCPGWLDMGDVRRVGNKIVDGRYGENENAGIVRQIFIWASQGRGGAWIAHQLNSTKPERVPTFRKIGPKMEKRIAEGRDPKWHPNVIRQLLRDRRVLGYLQPCIRVDGKRVSDGGKEVRIYPQIVDDLLWGRVQAVLRQRPNQTRAGRKDRGTVNLARGLCRCEVCKKGVVIRHQKNKDYLVCEMARHSDCSNHRYFPYQVFERMLIGLLHHDMGGLLRGMFPKPEPHHSQVDELENKLDGLRMQRRRLMSEFGRGDATARELIDELADQIGHAEKALAAARDDDLIAQHDDDPRSLKRIREALARLHVDDPEAREEARAMLAQELSRRIERVVLQPDKTLRVDINDGRRGQTAIETVMNADLTLASMRTVLRRDGSVFMNFPKEALARMRF
jgi:Resolvase, N terminal domain/Recombinase